MGCGASRSVSTGETDDSLVSHGNVSTTQIRDIAPTEVRDTGGKGVEPGLLLNVFWSEGKDSQTHIYHFAEDECSSNRLPCHNEGGVAAREGCTKLAHPPPRLPCIRPDRKALWITGADDVSPPGTVPDSISHDSEADTESSLIRKHPPRRPQRLEEQPIAVLSANVLGTRGSAGESRIKDEDGDVDQAVTMVKSGRLFSSSSEPL